MLRIAAAGAVLFFHSFALNALWGVEPLGRLLAGHDAGAVGVGVFFFISGLLVTQSYIRSPSLVAYLVARVLRIYPALIAAVVLSLFLAWLSSGLTLREFVSASDVQQFPRAALGISTSDRIGTAYVHNPYPFAINGSLWTLPIELRFYWIVAVVGLAGLLARPAWLLLAVCALAVVINTVPAEYSYGLGAWPVAPLAVLFALGGLAGAWSHRIRLSIPIAIALVALAFVFPVTVDSTPRYCTGLAYVVLVLAYHPALRLPDVFRNHDYSYGLYVYAFPVQQTVLSFGGPFARDPIGLFLISVPLVLVLSAASWHLLERRALGLKRLVRRRESNHGVLTKQPGHDEHPV